MKIVLLNVNLESHNLHHITLNIWRFSHRFVPLGIILILYKHMKIGLLVFLQEIIRFNHRVVIEKFAKIHSHP